MRPTALFCDLRPPNLLEKTLAANRELFGIQISSSLEMAALGVPSLHQMISGSLWQMKRSHDDIHDAIKGERKRFRLSTLLSEYDEYYWTTHMVLLGTEHEKTEARVGLYLPNTRSMEGRDPSGNMKRKARNFLKSFQLRCTHSNS